MVTATIVFVYNMTQFAAWAWTLFLLVWDFREGKTSQYTDNEDFRFALAIAQCSQSLDILFSALRWTPNALGTVLMQLASRLFVVLVVFPLAVDTQPFPFIEYTVLAWSITEIIRFIFYSFKSLQSIVGHLRYNSFLVLYPLGVSCECACFLFAHLALGKMSATEQEEKMLLVQMPNYLNVGLSIDYLIMLMAPTYAIGFPMLFGHMLAQRKKFYGAGSADKTVKQKSN